jgi:hypothetical protein
VAVIGQERLHAALGNQLAAQSRRVEKLRLGSLCPFMSAVCGPLGPIASIDGRVISRVLAGPWQCHAASGWMHWSSLAFGHLPRPRGRESHDDRCSRRRR